MRGTKFSCPNKVSVRHDFVMVSCFLILSLRLTLISMSSVLSAREVYDPDKSMGWHTNCWASEGSPCLRLITGVNSHFHHPMSLAARASVAWHLSRSTLSEHFQWAQVRFPVVFSRLFTHHQLHTRSIALILLCRQSRDLCNTRPTLRTNTKSNCRNCQLPQLVRMKSLRSKGRLLFSPIGSVEPGMDSLSLHNRKSSSVNI